MRIARKINGGIRCLKENGFGYTIRLLFQRIKWAVRLLAELAVEKTFVGRFVKMIRVQTYGPAPNGLYVFAFGKQIYPGRRKGFTNSWADSGQPVIYFKINRRVEHTRYRGADYIRICIQHWVDIAYQMKADFYFICDNDELKLHVLENVCFPSADVKFISSMRKELTPIAKTLSTPQWLNAAYCHLTPFYHAEQIHRKKFWAIDADDTTVCMQPNRAAEALRMVQQEAERNDLSVCSLDIWYSHTHGRHWSWGIAYVNNTVDFCKIFRDNRDLSWVTVRREENRLYCAALNETNLDWYFTYLADNTEIKIKTFYIDNSWFIHWGNFLHYPRMLAGIYSWREGKLFLPILKYIYQDDARGEIPVADDCLPIDIKMTTQESISFLRSTLSKI